MTPSYEDTEIVKILAPLTDNINASDEKGETLLSEAVYCGLTEIVKILAPLTDNPNAPNNIGETPIYRAACNGYTEIVKILSPLTDNPNTQNRFGEYPSSVSKNTEIRRFLESFNSSKKSKLDYQPR